MANSVPACINLHLKQKIETHLTKYLSSSNESEKVQKNDRRIYLNHTLMVYAILYIST